MYISKTSIILHRIFLILNSSIVKEHRYHFNFGAFFANIRDQLVTLKLLQINLNSLRIVINKICRQNYVDSKMAPLFIRLYGVTVPKYPHTIRRNTTTTSAKRHYLSYSNREISCGIIERIVHHIFLTHVYSKNAKTVAVIFISPYVFNINIG